MVDKFVYLVIGCYLEMAKWSSLATNLRRSEKNVWKYITGNSGMWGKEICTAIGPDPSLKTVRI